ncbi:hypothetical protein EDD36DRAFT_329547 [Exophiala viscosa]|uniref:BTB domain-containing protein n=1 Tax=Exophiala viscosa TaxID=2486360 RepID=A0AAN6DS22_9EURO|nr:hypothetical protein EDD36DRAFT_329547 [Exophiala viscosa]
MILPGLESRSIHCTHRSLLLKSPFFAGCLTSGMREQQNQEIVLPGDQCRGFDYVADWIYNEKVRSIPAGDKRELHSGIIAYVLADKYCMPALQNALTDELADHFAWTYFNPDNITLLAKLGVETGPLCDLMLAKLAYDLVNYPSTYYPRPDDGGEEVRHSDLEESESSDGLSDLDDGDTMPGWLEALERVLAHPALSTKLLRNAARTKKLGPNPAESTQRYHVAVDANLGRGQKRKADELQNGSNGSIEGTSNMDI